MRLNDAQRELLALWPELDVRDIPKDWSGGGDLDEKIEANRRRREAAQAKALPAPPAAKPKTSRHVTLKMRAKDIEDIAEYMAVLERRIEQLEKRNALSFAGTWREDRHYRAGELAQHGGSLWMCTADTTGARPNHSSHWRLLIKRGSFREEVPK